MFQCIKGRTIKLFVIAVAFGMLVASATMSIASDSIDSAGTTKLTINSPAAAIATSASQQVSLDSNGYLSASLPKIVTAERISAKNQSKTTCLDSGCIIQL